MGKGGYIEAERKINISKYWLSMEKNNQFNP
jgi:hypothetical protein